MDSDKNLERHRAYRHILDLIIGGEVDAKAPLSERRLSGHLQIGRTPVREALRDLVRDGVLEVHPARGTYVREMSLNDIREIYEVRHALEGLAAFLAAENGPTDGLAAFGPLFEGMVRDPAAFDPEVVYQRGVDFHLEVFRAAGNRNLLATYEPIRLRFKIAFGLPRFYDHKRVIESVTEHLDVLRAIEAGDGAAAQTMICDHLSAGLLARMKIFEDIKRLRPVAIAREASG
ncbi:MAG: GntR family transcriptional regulator [Pseudomonadota bacterium]